MKVSDKIMNETAAKGKAVSIEIPAQPHVISNLIQLINSEEVCIADVADVVKKDPSLSAQVLKVANSPFFGLRNRVDSIPYALSLMGLTVFKRAILASALREAYGKNTAPWFEAFWTHSEFVAGVCGIVARKFCRELFEEAYLAGLFHDCGIPLMVKRFPEFEDCALKAMSSIAPLISEEEEQFGTNHAVVGYLLSRSWHLPESVCLAILKHHDVGDCLSVDSATQSLLSALMISEYVVVNYDGTGNVNTLGADQWLEERTDIIDILGVNADDINDISYEFTDTLLSS